jgi:hypothetical protein
MPELRTRSAGAKVTEKEYAEIEKLAEARGLNVGEWCREVILAELERGESPSAETVLAEVLALRMIFLNAIAAMGQGRELTTEQMQKLIERADAEKFRKVAERVEQQSARKKPRREKASGNGRSG